MQGGHCAAGVLWRLAKAATFIAQLEGAQGNTEEKKEMHYEAWQQAELALSRDDTDPNAHKW